MGIPLSLYIQEIIALPLTTLANPFGLTYLPLMHESLKALQQIFIVAWARMANYRGDILKPLTASWLRIQEDPTKSTDLVSICEEIEFILKMFTIILTRNVDIRYEYQNLIDSDSRLQKLLLPLQNMAHSHPGKASVI